MVIKGNGEREEFKAEKLRSSLLNAGADREAAESIVKHIEDELREDITTKEIYEHAHSILKDGRQIAAAQYSLRQAIMELGPTGYPFEKFIGEIYEALGYTIETDRVLKGYCVEHEVDLIAHTENELILGEAKFHNERGITSDVQTALYVKARFDDLRDVEFDYGPRKMTEGLLVTNTKFTRSAVQYGECAGLRLIGWNYPKQGNLQTIINESGLYPVTCLSSIDNVEKKVLTDQGTALCKSVKKDREYLRSLGFSDQKIDELSAEISALCGSHE